MSLTLRIALLAVSVLNFVWTVIRIRKAQVKIEDTVFWILFSALLIIMSVYPGLVEWGARLMGVQSASNFVFLAMIFVLLLKIFRMSIRISQLESKVQTFAQTYAISEIEDNSQIEV